MKRLSVFAACLVAGSVLTPDSLWAQEQQRGGQQADGGQNTNRPRNAGNQARRQAFPLWKAELPGGTYIVARTAINSVSSQEYILDGVARVTEVNVTTTGNFHPRFYYLEMLPANAPSSASEAQIAIDHAQAAAADLVKDAAPEATSKVVKNYPATTHASTIEYRLDSPEQIQKLFESVERVWLTGVSEVYTPNGIRRYDPSKEIKNADDGNSSNDTGSGQPGDNNDGAE